MNIPLELRQQILGYVIADPDILRKDMALHVYNQYECEDGGVRSLKQREIYTSVNWSAN